MTARGKKIALAFGTFFGLLIALELGLRIGGYEGAVSDPYASFVLHQPLFQRDGDRFTLSPTRRIFFHEQSFPAVKPAGTVRFFVFGGSVTHGYRLADPARDTYVERLRKDLASRFPGRTFEAINCGGLSYASYRHVGLVEECLAYDPDFIIVMTGHNEFLEPRLYRDFLDGSRPAGGCLDRIKIVQLSQDIRTRMDAGPGTQAPAVLADYIDEKYIVRDPQEFDATLDHYRRNLGKIAEACRAKGVPLILCTSPSNLRNWAPFVTPPAETLDTPAMEAAVKQIAELRKAGRHTDALAAAERIVVVAPRAAMFHYLAAAALDELGRKEEAKARYILARDTDGFPHRAPSSFNDTVRGIAAETGVLLFDADRLFESKAPDGIPGKELFVDQCHPNAEGHRLFAEGLLQVIAEEGFVQLAQ